MKLAIWRLKAESEAAAARTKKLREKQAQQELRLEELTYKRDSARLAICHKISTQRFEDSIAHLRQLACPSPLLLAVTCCTMRTLGFRCCTWPRFQVPE